MLGHLIIAVLAYLCVALGFRWGKQVGRGAERWEYQQQADANGGYIFLGQSRAGREADRPDPNAYF